MNIYLCKVSNRNSRAMCEICSKAKIKTAERLLPHNCSASIYNFKYTIAYWELSTGMSQQDRPVLS